MIYYLPKNLVAPVSNTSPQANILNPRVKPEPMATRYLEEN